MDASQLLTHLAQFDAQKAIVSKNKSITFSELIAQIREISETWRRQYHAQQILLLKGKYSINTIAAFFAALEAGFHLVLAPRDLCFTTDDVFWSYQINFSSDKINLIQQGKSQKPQKLLALEHKGEAALILLTSGSEGPSKQVMYSFQDFIMDYLHRSAKNLVTVPVMPFDHFGGLDVCLRVLCSGGTLVIPEISQPAEIFRAAEDHRANFLSATPSFFRMALAAGIPVLHPLPDLRWINLGAEAIAPALIRRLSQVFPQAEIRQTFGTTESGVVAMSNSGTESLTAIKNGMRITNGSLQVKRHPAFLGYLNQDDPGEYISTNDLAEENTGSFRILGRSSRIINTGGEKVHPEVVEAVLLEHPKIQEVRVFAEPHPLLGQIICAEVLTEEKGADLRTELRKHCRERLLPHQVPVKFRFSAKIGISNRWKKK
ncbi:MAG: fatty acid--CoA ligase family protein [Bacteroidia bacterium]